MRKKMAAAVLMAAMTASLLAGCGDSKSSDSTKADSAQTTASNQSEAGDSTSDLKDGKTEELLMVWPGSNASPADMQAVEDAMNEIIGEKVDAKVKLQIIEWGAYNDQTNLMLSSGEKLDMVFLMSNIREDGQRGQLYPINDLIETYAPDAYSAMERYIEACYFDGNLYGLPTYRDLASQAGFMCRADILEELGYKAEDIKNFDDIEEVLKKCQEVHPELYPMIPSDLNNGCFLNYVKGEFDVVTSGVGVDIDDDASDGITVINTYDTEKYKEMAEKAYDWNQKGYFMPDSTTNTTTRQDLFRANTAFSYYGNQHPGTATQETMNSGKEIVSIPIGRSTISTSSVNFCQWAIPAQCENPKKALAVLNLLYSDSDFQNLFRYGIEGKDYVVSDGIASYPDGVTSDSVGWGNELWLCGNSSVGYAWETDPENVYEKFTEYNDTAQESPLYGFIYDTTNVKNEITAITNVTDKYKAIIENGDADPSTTLPQFNEELKSAGIDNIIEDMQKQVDEWLANK